MTVMTQRGFFWKLTLVLSHKRWWKACQVYFSDNVDPYFFLKPHNMSVTSLPVDYTPSLISKNGVLSLNSNDCFPEITFILGKNAEKLLWCVEWNYVWMRLRWTSHLCVDTRLYLPRIFHWFLQMNGDGGISNGKTLEWICQTMIKIKAEWRLDCLSSAWPVPDWSCQFNPKPSTIFMQTLSVMGAVKKLKQQ